MGMIANGSHDHQKDLARPSRRGFGAGLITGLGLALGFGAERAGLAAHVSLKEASYYESFEPGREEHDEERLR